VITVGSDAPRPTIAKKQMITAIQLLLVIILMRQARKIWIGVDTATYAQHL